MKAHRCGKAFYAFVKERCETTLKTGIAELEKVKAEPRVEGLVPPLAGRNRIVKTP